MALHVFVFCMDGMHEAWQPFPLSLSLCPFLTRRNGLVNQVKFLGLAYVLRQQHSKHFAENLLKKSTDTQMEMKKFYWC